MPNTLPAPEPVRIGIVSISDRASGGVYEDKGLPALNDWLKRALHNPIAFERFTNGVRLARQVQDQRGMIRGFADHCDLARQDGSRHEMQADLPHLLAEAGHFLGSHRQRRFWCHIAPCRAGAAGRDNKIAAKAVNQIDQRTLDLCAVIGNQSRFGPPGTGQRACEPVDQRGNPLVFVNAVGGAIGNRHQPDQGFVRIHPFRSAHDRSQCDCQRFAVA